MGEEQQDAPSAAGLWLPLLGLAGLTGAITLGLVTLFGSYSSLAVALALYVAGVVAMTIGTAGAALRRPTLWALRLCAPLLGPVLVLLIGALLRAGAGGP